VWWNILNMCRRHHARQHEFGWPKFLAVYPEVKEALFDRGWEIIDSVGRAKLWNPLLREM
jgi:hypothetical protein